MKLWLAPAAQQGTHPVSGRIPSFTHSVGSKPKGMPCCLQASWVMARRQIVPHQPKWLSSAMSPALLPGGITTVLCCRMAQSAVGDGTFLVSPTVVKHSSLLCPL